MNASDQFSKAENVCSSSEVNYMQALMKQTYRCDLSTEPQYAGFSSHLPCSHAGGRARQFLPLQPQIVDDLAHHSGIERLMTPDVWKHGPTIAKTHRHISVTSLMDGVAAGFEGASTLG
jgi:hypothetical protein